MPYFLMVAFIIALGLVLWRLTITPGDAPAPRPRAPRGPIGPDDDPDFLLDLRRKNQGRDS
ncbi:hypothetical protein [Gordonia sp. (in: high G+C Gram-positive bacteria)]|uniref:hypothetical protein n=1 Tax=Gordonia sp. (in: high G+C Gram-positive bacteria) TaxID=84139 RepID=UPI0039E4CA8A